MENEDFLTLTKKEQLTYKRKFDRINKTYKWVTKLAKKPSLVIVVDGTMLNSFVDELSQNKDIDGVIISSTNFARYYAEDRLIIANMWSYKSLDFVMKYILS